MERDRGASRWKTHGETWGRLRGSARENRRTATEAEAALWEYLRGGRLRGFKFRRQHAIGPHIVDFYCASARLVVEVDGPIHDRQVEADASRTAFLEQFGLKVLRVSNDQVLERIAETRELIDRTLTASPSPSDGEGD